MRSFTNLHFAKSYSVDALKKDEMGRSCSTHDGKRSAYNTLVGEPEGKRPLGKHRRKLEDSITMDLREMGWLDVDWIHLAKDTDQWRAFVNTVMNLWIP
jgi:hypothetical protein